METTMMVDSKVRLNRPEGSRIVLPLCSNHKTSDVVMIGVLNADEIIGIIVRYYMRKCFSGIDKYNECGYFIDYGLCPITHEYTGWVSYIKGDHTLTDHKNSVTALVISDCQRYLFSASQDTSIIFWNLITNRSFRGWKAHDFPVWCLAYCKKKLASGDTAGIIKLWDISNPFDHRLITRLSGHNRVINSLDFNSQGDRLVSSSNDGTMCLWSMETHRCIDRSMLPSHQCFMRAAMFAGGNDQTLLCSSDDCRIKTANVRHIRRSIRTVQRTRKNCIYQMNLSCDESFLACAGSDSTIVFDWPIKRRPCLNITHDSFAVCFHPLIPHILAVGSNLDYSVRLVDVTTGEWICRLAGHTTYIRTLCFSANGLRIISGSMDNCIRIWDLSR